MPYITQGARPALDPLIEPLYEAIQTDGELNYVLTKVIDAWFARNPRYDGVKDCVAALECAKLEFYRRVAAPYEDEKCQANGDVYASGVK